MNIGRTRFDAPEGHFSGPPNLAHIEAFEVAGVRIVPAERRLFMPNGCEGILEPLVMQVLVVLAGAGGRTLSRDDLVDACWGRRIVGDDAVNRVMSRLRRSLSEICGDRLRITTIAKVGYRLEFGSEAGKTEGQPRTFSTTTSQNRNRRLRPIGFAAVALASFIALGAASLFVASPAAGVAIAIEPGAGEAADPTTAAFASDLTTDIADLTGAMTSLTLVELNAPTDADLTLQVAYRGKASDGGARVRLVDASNGAVIWSRVFEGRDTPETVVRERVAHSIAGVIRCGLDRSAGNLGDPVSKRLYFNACDAVQVRDWAKARSYARQIVDRRPDSGASWACLAMTTANAAYVNPSGRDAAAREAMRYAQRAISLDPRSGLAHQSLAVALQMQGKPGLSAIENGVRMDPEHAGLLASYSFDLFDMGYVSAALDPALRATVLDPGDYGMATTAFYVLLGAGRLADARRQQAKVERIWGRERKLDGLRASLAFYDPDPLTALANYDARPLPYPGVSEIARSELVWRTDPKRFDWPAFDHMADRLFHADPSTAWNLTFAATRMKDLDRAFAWLAKSHSTMADMQWFMLFYPDAAELRRDPRFFAKMAEVGLLEEWQRRGRWPDFCSDSSLRYDCRQIAKKIRAAQIWRS